MRYKIHTAPIIDAYKEAARSSKKDGVLCACPLCIIEKTVEQKCIESYLGTAVMEPSSRVEVNKLGFCENHFSALLAGDNILGVCLQARTRIGFIKEHLTNPTNAKTAKIEGARVRKSTQTCVICDHIESQMSRYIETVATLFGVEIGFESLLRGINGHCQKHFGMLLEYANFAKARCQLFCDILYSQQLKLLLTLDGELQLFINQFDAHKRSTDTGGGMAFQKDILDEVLRTVSI